MQPDQNAQRHFPRNLVEYHPGGEEVRKSHIRRVESGFFDKYLCGPVVLDIGFRGHDNPEGKTVVPHAVGVDHDFPGYDGINLPFAENSVDCVFSSHCLEHVQCLHHVVCDWMRILKIGGFVVCVVPHQHLYEKRRFAPSIYNSDHKHFFTPSSLLRLFEDALEPNSYRVRHLIDNDAGFSYEIPPERHSAGCYEIELVIEKILKPSWVLA